MLHCILGKDGILAIRKAISNAALWATNTPDQIGSSTSHDTERMSRTAARLPPPYSCTRRGSDRWGSRPTLSSDFGCTRIGRPRTVILSGTGAAAGVAQ